MAKDEQRRIQAACLPVVYGKLVSGQTFAWNILLDRLCVDLGDTLDLLEGEVSKEGGVSGRLITFLAGTERPAAALWIEGGPLPSFPAIEA